MIDYFVRRLGGVRGDIGRRDAAAFRAKARDAFPQQAGRGRRSARSTEGSMNLPDDCARAGSVAGGPFKFTLTSPYMLARTLLDEHYHDLRALTLAIADALAAQARDLRCACVQVDEANIPGNPDGRPAGRRGDQPRARRGAGREGRALLLRQLRRPDDSARDVARAGFVPERAARGSPRPRAGAPPGVRSRRAARAAPGDRRSGSASSTSRSITSKRRTRSPRRSSAPSRRSGPAACATCIRTAASGCSSDRWPTGRLRRW